MSVQITSASLLFLFVVSHSMAFGQEVVPERATIGEGVALHYVERGEGEPIIFIHGFMDDYSVWMRQLEGFANEGFRAIAYSRRHNYPNENQVRPNHSATVEADDLAALIRELDLERAHIVGHSYGGYTALFLALEFPDLVRTVTLAEPPIVPWLANLPGDQSESGKAQLEKLMSQGVNPARAALDMGDEEAAIRAMFDSIGGTGLFDVLPQFVKDKCRRNILELRAFIQSEDRYPDVDRDDVRRLAVPTLILSGSDSVATARFTDPEIERLISAQSRERVVLQGATHIMWIEQPVQCREAVLEFIRGE